MNCWAGQDGTKGLTSWFGGGSLEEEMGRVECRKGKLEVMKWIRRCRRTFGNFEIKEYVLCDCVKCSVCDRLQAELLSCRVRKPLNFFEVCSWVRSKSPCKPLFLCTSANSVRGGEPFSSYLGHLSLICEQWNIQYKHFESVHCIPLTPVILTFWARTYLLQLGMPSAQ